MKQNKSYTKHLALAVCGVMLTTSCTNFVPTRENTSKDLVPAQFSVPDTQNTAQQLWWKEFNSPELDRLMELAFSKNLTLEQARARLEQARAQARLAGADLYPSLSATAGAGRTKTHKPDIGPATTTDSYTLGGSASYEIDLWGRVRFGRKSALLAFEASEFDLQTAAITLAGQIAGTWVDITGQQAQKNLLEQQLKTAQTYLSLVEMRFKSAMVSALDVYQQKQNVAKIQAQLPLVEAQIRTLYTTLCVLTATPVDQLPQIKQDQLSMLPPTPPIGIPAQLLENRPDIKAAFLRLRSSDYTLGQKKADRLPAISITATGTFDSPKTASLFDNWLLNLAGNLAMPIIDGGAKRANRDLAAAAAREKLAAYRLTVLQAIQDVEDSLALENRQIEHITALKEQNEYAKQALEQAQQRYRKGLNDYLPVLTSLSTTQTLENSLILRKTELLKYRINLCKAVGGTWPTIMLEENKEQNNKDKAKQTNKATKDAKNVQHK